jgi:glycosyltransferase involved in cell wall biosynthesis
MMDGSPYAERLTSPLRILTISSYYPPFHGGGYGLHCQWYAEALAQRGHVVEVITSRPPRESGAIPTTPVVVRRELSEITGDLPAHRIVFETVRNHGLIQQSIRRFAPDIVFCHGIDGTGFDVYHAGNEAGLPSLSMVGDTWLAQAWAGLARFDPWNGLVSGRSRNPLIGAAKRLLGQLGKTAGIYVGPRPQRFYPSLVISSYLMKHLIAAGAPVQGRAVLFSPILHAQFFVGTEPVGHSGVRSPQLRCLFLGRMELAKGPDLAIQGVAAALRQGANVTLTIAGLPKDDLGVVLRRLAEESGIADRCFWAGSPADSELLNLYRNHDVFLFPSRIKEGFGLVNAEAMACGLPVIGRVFSGPADLIIEGQTGCPIPDDPAAMASHLVSLYQNPALLETLSRGACQAVRRLHPTTVTDSLELRLTEAIEIFHGKRSAFSSTN